MRAWASLLAGAALALGGCNLTGDDDSKPPDGAAKQPDGRTGPAPDARPKRGEPAEAGPIRAWNAALNAGDFEKAASYFAAGAIVEQINEIRLRDRRAAIAFNRSLPCRSDVTDVDDDGRTTLVAFRLRPGRRGACRGGGIARVRFRVEDGKFKEWRQLTEPASQPGEIA